MASSVDAINEKSCEILKKLYNSEELDFDSKSKLLSEFKVLTRELTLTSDTIDKCSVNLLVNYSSKYFIEAQKCLSNLILNYAQLRDDLIGPYVDCVETRLSKILGEQESSIEKPLNDGKLCEVLYYDLRIIFLLSALCPTRRAEIRDHLFDRILEITVMEAGKFSKENHPLLVESLKTLFNLTLDGCPDHVLIGYMIRKLFDVIDTNIQSNFDTSNELELTEQLLVSLIHLLTNMPEESYLNLSDRDVNIILRHLDSQLKTFSRQNFRETILPVLNVCTNICKFNEKVRKRWFMDILGSSNDFEKRPEEYENLRGRLVKSMTSVDVYIKDIAAEFVYSLCGNDTEKFITYTGFGNSVAYLASRGMLDGSIKKIGETSRANDTNDYQQLRDKIDPITGKLDTPKKNPMDDMSEEEKEHHANELAKAISKLNNLGIVKPMSVSQDGKITDLFHPSSQPEE